MSFDYPIKVLQERLDFLKKRITYAKAFNDDLLFKRATEKSKELEKAIEHLTSSPLNAGVNKNRMTLEEKIPIAASEKAEEIKLKYLGIAKALFDGANISWEHCANKLAIEEVQAIISESNYIASPENADTAWKRDALKNRQQFWQFVIKSLQS